MSNLRNPPKLVIISNCSPGAAYVIKEVMRSFPVARIIRPVWGCQPRPLLSRVKAIAKAPGLFLVEAINERYRSRTSAWIATELQALLEASLQDLPDNLIVDIPSTDINSPFVAELIRSDAPDLMLVCGAPILRRSIYEIPPRGAINLHLGIAPVYRGEHTIHWPLINHDYRHIGVTVHRITAKVDAGPILARGYPQIEERDDEITLMAKSYRMGAQLADEVIKLSTERVLPLGKYFDVERGTLIRYRDLNILNLFRSFQAKVRRRPLPPLSARIERMYDVLDHT